MSANKTWRSEFHQEAIAGDSRYAYVPFHSLSDRDQRRARGQYPNRSVGALYDFVDEHYLYPVKRDGSLASARRELAIPYALIRDPSYMANLGYVKRPQRR